MSSRKGNIVTEDEFRAQLQAVLEPLRGKCRIVCGPGRSGAVASVYASHFLKIPWLLPSVGIPERLRPVLVIDTAARTGATLRKIQKRVGAEVAIALFDEPPRIRFWYEVWPRRTA